jgi:SAM-dependent methyltransferase
MNDVHPAAAEGFKRGIDTYVRGRPDFPPAALEWLKEDLGLRPGTVALDLGAGTGKFTRLMARSGAQVIAVEPSAAMLGRLMRELPAVTALRGTAQAIPLADSSVDAVVCAQAFHWFAGPTSLTEIHRVLKPDGVLGLIWNVRDESVDWVRRLDAIMSPYEGDAPRYYEGEWREAFPAPGFGGLRERKFVHEHVGPVERVLVDRVASVSFIAALDEKTRNEVLDEVRTLIADTPTLSNRPEIRVPYITHAYWARRLDQA